jgi:hypothetical protein
MLAALLPLRMLFSALPMPLIAALPSRVRFSTFGVFWSE